MLMARLFLYSHAVSLSLSRTSSPVSIMSLAWRSPRRCPGRTSTWHAPAEWSPCPWVSPARASAAASWWRWIPYYWALRSLRKTDRGEKGDGQGERRWWNNRGVLVRGFIGDFHLSAGGIIWQGAWDRQDKAVSFLPSQSNRANTTSHTWSDSSTLATVRATCFMVTGTNRETGRLWKRAIACDKLVRASS